MNEFPGMYYKRDGTEITFDEWTAYMYETGDQDAWQKLKRIAETTVGDWWISTVYLGMNHAIGGGPPLIFETMIFPTEAAVQDTDESRWGERWQDRYSTEEQAIAGHAATVEAVTKGDLP